MGTNSTKNAKDKELNFQISTTKIHGVINGYNCTGKKANMENSGQDTLDIIDLGPFCKYFAVYDGHGSKGREASDLVNNFIRSKIIQERKALISSTSTKYVAYMQKFFDNLFEDIQKIFLNNSNEYELSGTCVIGVFFNEPNCYFINLGDSRAVLGSFKNGKKISFEMTYDHKPNKESEQKRIVSNGGSVVTKLGGISRVCKKNEEVPGLAVSRSLGDIIAHECGVISSPVIECKELYMDDQFIVIGSDGIWDIMSSSEVVGFVFDILEKKGNRDIISQLLVEECRFRWEALSLYKEKFILENLIKVNDKEYSNSCDIDDITAIVFFPWKDNFDFE